jgi:hypothetical protein
LVSIENGSKIVEKKWITTSDKETKGSFEVTADMTPNVYVHITCFSHIRILWMMYQ